MAYLMEGETTMVVGGHRSRRKWRTTKEILDLQRPYLPIGFAVFLDLLFLYIPIINEDMKCLGLDTYRLSYSTWSILVFFFHSTRDAACLQYANPVLLTVTTISSEISHFYMVPMLQNMDQQTSVGSNF
ncbi:uncharacterized protein LOC133724403 isoform X2 [Rosa rugosa]|uniref:uncharacterized protein LOC133724403 isoform X2 n=1 Tax=Rosa rugosa TaxID=74645 RepID=UPI002B417333|nr:uncharacterized protein LOC133724403 isoform X2 [Rosa rugosa]